MSNHGSLEKLDEGTDEVTGESSPGVRRPLRVLQVSDFEDSFALVMRELRRGGYDPSVGRVQTHASFKDALLWKTWDVIISDESLSCYSGLRALADAREAGKDIPLILLSATTEKAGAVAAMRAGAHDYVLKDDLERLPIAVEREVRDARARAALRKTSEKLAISERMTSARMLASGVAHEINNPLAIIMANLDFVTELLGRDGGDKPEQKLTEIDGPLRDAREAATRIQGIVRDVQLFSGPRHEERGAVEVRSVIESSIRLVWNEIRHRARLVRDYGDVPMADSNEAALSQILLHVLVNAAHAMPEGNATTNELWVTTKTARTGGIVIEIRDTGVGISKDSLARIFDPFFTTKPIGAATGLGLSLCHQMITDLGGAIAVESELGKGTLVRITLPMARTKPHAKVPTVALDGPVPRASVLVVDDDVAVGRALERRLGRYHDVVVLTKGMEAVSRISLGERFDVIVADLMMPDLTGMEMHAELTRIDPDQAMRMVFLTSGMWTDAEQEFLDGVTNARIETPFEMVKILEIVARAPRRSDRGLEAPA
jgi:signal transduction histidine kinase